MYSLKMGEGVLNKGLAICVFLGMLLKSGSGAPSLAHGVSSGTQVLVITTTEDSATDATTVAPSLLESWEVDTNNNLSIDDKPAVTSSFMESAPMAKIKSTKPEIYSFKIKSDIKYRYCTTHVTSRVANRDSKSQEVSFRVILPETAFISKFIMEIDGKQYEAYVKEKEEAKKVYSEAQSQGHSAGLVEVSTRNSNTFNVNVNIRQQSKVTFNLTYEELLTRRLGKYEQVINIVPDQVKSVKDFQIVVNIEESQNITFLRVPNLRNDIESVSDMQGNNKDAIIVQDGNKANISWSPSLDDQEKLSEQGVGGKFVVQYDINRDSTSGEVLVMEGYFVHFFAPENLKPLRKHVVFILDISGSMWGRKMEQLKEAQKKILDDLNADDFFNIITFSGDVFLWSPKDTTSTKHSGWYPPSFLSSSSKKQSAEKQQPYSATPENIVKAKAFIDSLIASGGTNIHDAIITAIDLTSTVKLARDGVFPSTDEIEEELPEPLAMVEIVKMSSNSSAEEVVTEIDITTTSSTTSRKPAIRRVLPDTILPKNVESLIIFLTDGEPTVGVTDPPYIRELIQAANKNLTLPIFSLGFGEGADFPFLKKLSLQNYGFARKIYEASDAALQLKGFYNEIASPLLANVMFNYTSLEHNVTDVTVTAFPTVFGGTEIAVAGRLVPLAQTETSEFDDGVEQATEGTTTILSTINENTTSNSNSTVPLADNAPLDDKTLILSNKNILDVGIIASGRDGVVSFKPPPIFCHPIDRDDIIRPPFPPRPTSPPTAEDKFLERLWAYLTIQQLIEQDLKNEDTRNNEIPADSSLSDPVSSTMGPESQTVSNSSSNTTENTKPETSKQHAIRLALKYGFVTPFTSLVVVKPNSSDVTNTVPADAPTSDTADSLSSPQSMHYFAVVQPQPLSLQGGGLANRIVGGSPAMHQPLYSSIRRRPAGYGHPLTTTHRPRPTSAFPAPFFSTAILTADYEVTSVETTEGETYFTERTTSKNLTLKDIQWITNSSNPSFIQINETDYTIAVDTTVAVSQKSECSINEEGTGQCLHLRDCVQNEFIADFGLFKSSYFCPIQTTTTSNVSYVGVCCSSAESNQQTTATPFMLP